MSSGCWPPCGRKRWTGPKRWSGDAMYEWIKAFHVLAVISWMAGMLYLPRLMVYHAESAVGSIQSETFKIMERRLLKGIINPAMIVTWVLGLYLAWAAFGFKGGWLHGKILLVFILSGIHGYLVGRVRDFANDRNTKSARFYRIINEVPAVLMVGIVILVVVKPF
ncbi:MAG TPA: protoporphyrinogen oxidase HemJ [Bosea sp. (in: a-proteobacteria)]